jgi:hypothetical protein
VSDPTNRRPDREEDGVPEALRQAWETLPKPEPPDLIDQSVLNRARAAVDAPHSSRPWSFGWPHALTTTAVIVLAITLVIPLRETGQPGGIPESADPVPQAENRSQNDLELQEEMLQDTPATPPETSARARREAAPRALASPALEKTAPAAMESAASADAAMIPDVADRLQEIRELAETGELDAAKEALKAFREEFPDAEVPPELLVLLEPSTDESQP